ncbi:hypothetical protein [Paludifilum halophilum]|uniref:Tox-REase-5 domain-containing protein n=1 Tax=Paludifilum halophilum TaxID=1642702 RepID=A0A235B682_9BACL|nr:hypothetical protein [Paludifilum halophilum]OYD07741.1 hypothetical protein CHM34_09730 [Paludifilum halophilum]
MNGVLSGLSGHDVGSSMFYGGLAGMIGLGVGGAVYKGVGSLVGRYAGPFLSKWLPRSLGGGSGAFADLFSFDWMKEGTFNWKKALIGGGVIGAFTFGGGLFLDKAVPPLAHAMKQLGWNIEVGGDGTLAMPWIRGADEAADGYRKAAGKGTGGTKEKFKPGTPEHKAQRWEEYKESGGTWDYEHWSKNYDNNIHRAKKSEKAMNDYWERIGWGEREVDITINGHTRVLDIADVGVQKGIEHKTRTGTSPRSGYFSLTEEIRWEIKRDAMLVKDDWDITWVFEDAKASKPLLEALEEAGIKYKYIEKGGT